MDVFPKYIIETDDELGDCLILGKCTYHKQLGAIEENIKSGGWYNYDHDTNTFTFNGESHDFGRATLEDVKACVENDKVFTNSALIYSIAKNHKFKYDRQSEIVEIN